MKIDRSPNAMKIVEYTIDDVARRSKTTVRNVRAYQDRGLVPPPVRRGRANVYGGAHVARLRLIGQLLARGYSLGNIGELLAAWESGRDLDQILGFEAAVAEPFVVEEPEIVDELVAAGIPIAAALATLRSVRKDVETIAGRLVALVVEQLLGGARLPKATELRKLAEVVSRIRPLAERVVDAELARALENAARDLRAG